MGHAVAISTLRVDVVLTDTAGAVRNERFPFSLRAPNVTTTSVRTPNGPVEIPTTLTAVLSDSTAEIDIAREVRMRGEVLRPKDHESWRLSADGRELHISREAQMPRPEGLVTYTIRYVFVRV